jgi:protein XRP2
VEVVEVVEVEEEVPKVVLPPAKKKFNRADYMFNQKSDETLVKYPGELDGKAFNIRYLENCVVYLYDHTSAINVDQCNNCTMIVGPVKGSIFVRDCTNCTIHVACSQFRCRDLLE